MLWLDLLKILSKYHIKFFIIILLKCFSALLRTFESFHSSSVTMPVILYNGSEEELMDTIEREFSWPPIAPVLQQFAKEMVKKEREPGFC